MNFVFCGHCYSTEGTYPFGFCYDCWVKHDKPEAMKVDGDWLPNKNKVRKPIKRKKGEPSQKSEKKRPNKPNYPRKRW